MGKRMVILLACLGWLWGWAAPGWALYPPAREGFNAWKNNNTINYTVNDPFTGAAMTGSWTWDPSYTFLIQDPIVVGGIVAWISGVTDAGDTETTFTVNYRIYDPGRGRWMAGEHIFATGANRAIWSLIVNAGVVAWKTVCQSNSSPTPPYTIYGVTSATYNPVDGTWPEDNYQLSVPYGSNRAVENLRVFDGVVAWPNYPLTGNCDVNMRIFDPEINQWVGFNFSDVSGHNLEWIEVFNATVHIRLDEGILAVDIYISYDASSHEWKWGIDPSYYPWASFVAQPAAGYPPLKVCFWDRSIADTVFVPNPFYIGSATRYWDFGDGTMGAGPSPVHVYNASGGYLIKLGIEVPDDSHSIYQQTVTVKPIPTFTGGISINGGDIYTNSTNVSLALQFRRPDGAQMRFNNPLWVPGWIDYWLDWEPYAPTKAWSLLNIDGVRSVYVQFKDNTGFLSDVYGAAVILDTLPPSGHLVLNDGKATTSNPVVRVTIEARDVNGVSKMHWLIYNEGDPIGDPSAWSPWFPYVPTIMTAQFNRKPGKKAFVVEFEDVAGNHSKYQAFITLKCNALPFMNMLLD